MADILDTATDARRPGRLSRRAVIAAAAVVAVAAVGDLASTRRAADRHAADRAAAAAREQAYLAAVRADRPFGDELIRSGRPADFTDAELLWFGRAACASFAAGFSVDQMSHAYGYFTLPDSTRGLSNPYLPAAAHAALLLCPTPEGHHDDYLAAPR